PAVIVSSLAFNKKLQSLAYTLLDIIVDYKDTKRTIELIEVE
ncbi:10736_t:CDS:1, partial [Dentiscutata heterogama]